MNYENYLNNDYQEKINEANRLLNEAKELLKAENIDSLLNAKFSLLSAELRELIVSINNLKLSETTEHLKHYNYNELQKSYMQNKSDLVETLAKKVDFESLFLANKDTFISINDKHFKQEVENALDTNESVNNTIADFTENINEIKTYMQFQAKSEIDEAVESIDFNALAKDFLEKEIIKIGESEKEIIAKHCSDALLSDEGFSIEAVNLIMENSIFQSKFKNALNEVLESLNQRALERVLNHRELKKMLILQDMITASLSLQNELKIISENMSFINDYKLIEKRKEFLESLNDENAKLLLENKFKAV